MKKYIFMVAALALTTMVSCNKEEINNSPEEAHPNGQVPTIPFEFNAYVDGANQPQVRAELNTDGTTPKTYWLTTDMISVTGNNVTGVFSVDADTECGETARFLADVAEGFSAPFKAVYPSEAGTFESLTVPDVQTAVEGTFDPLAHVAVAFSEDNTLSFKNVTSLLKFQVPAAADFDQTVTSVTITSTTALAGTVSVEMSAEDSAPEVTVKSSKNQITVNCKDGFDPEKTYYVAVLPGEKVDFVVRVNGYLSRNAESVNIKRSTIMNMQQLPAPVASGWTIVGTHNDWNTSTGIKLYNDISGSVAKNVSGGTEFKMVKSGTSWYSTMIPAGAKGYWCKLHANRVNMKPAAGDIDVWVNSTGDACGVVAAGEDMPTIYQHYVVLQHNWSWANRKLHSWIVSNNSNLMGNWPGSSPKGTFQYNGQSYSYWEIPQKANSVKIGIIFSNNGNDQTGDYFINPLNTDKCFWLNYTSEKGNFPVEM